MCCGTSGPIPLPFPNRITATNQRHACSGGITSTNPGVKDRHTNRSSGGYDYALIDDDGRCTLIKQIHHINKFSQMLKTEKMTSTEKPSVKHDSIHESISDANAIETSMPTKDVGHILTRIDWRLLPALGLIYGISLMDRTSTANAAVAGMLVDLNIDTGIGYNIITLSYFLSNIVAQPVMAVLCRKVGPKPFLSGVCIAWGVVVIGLGFTKEWVVQIPLRLLLGLFEAGFGPSAIYLLSTWYTRCMYLFIPEVIECWLNGSRRGGKAILHLLFERSSSRCTFWSFGLRFNATKWPRGHCWLEMVRLECCLL